MKNQSIIIEKRTASAIEISEGEQVAIIEAEGPQIAVLIAFNRNNLAEHFSPGNTRIALGMGPFAREDSPGLMPYWIQEGDTLVSNRWNKMMTLAEDTYGKHDIVFDPCDSFLNVDILGQEQGYPGCREVHANALKEWGIESDDIPAGVNLFQNTTYSDKGMITLPSVSSKDDMVTFQAHMDLIISVSACPCPLGENLPVKVEIK